MEAVVPIDGFHMRSTLNTRRKRYHKPQFDLTCFVLHGAVDDYSTWYNSHNDQKKNKAMTVTTFFDYPLETYSLPLTVGTDKKGESTLI